MKRLGTWVLIVSALVLFASSFAAYQYRVVRAEAEKELLVGNYPAVLNAVSELRKTILLLPLRWGTPFFLKNSAAWLYFMEAEVWDALGEKRQARQSYEKAAGLFTEARKKDRASAFYNSATIALELQKFLEARELLRKALDPVSGNPYHAFAKANLERLEQLAATEGILSGSPESGDRPLFFERDPYSPWQSDPLPGRKPAEKRR